ncbi:MAG: fasciclin domain-containing protein [Paludibacter sp.]|nr:fasciclin domain-containing protein [Paludibacter sp.]
MKKSMKITLLLSLVLLFVTSCSNEKDVYFARPTWLEPPIYQVLQEKGRFTNYLKCVDRTLYASSLNASGLYTVFAPNDDAFATYLAGKGYATVADMPDTLVNQIVSYSIVYNSYLFDHLTDVLSSGWDTLTSIKKKTTYYELIHQDIYKGKTVWVYDLPSFSSGDQNYKYVPFYLKRVFESLRSSSVAAEDYGMFYPAPSQYTGENIQNASILTKDMIAENGVVYEINQVLEPLQNFENLLNNSDYSDFKDLINTTGSTGEPYFITYQYDKSLTDYFIAAEPDKNINEVYIKYYSGLQVNLNGERYGESIKEAEQGGYTVFAPNNSAVQKFYNEKLKDYYPNGIKTASKDVLNYFINAQLCPDMVWPGDFKGSTNVWGEYLNGMGSRGDAFDKTKYTKISPASNGLFYGSSDYIKSRYFETVFTEILLNSKYSLLNTAFLEFFETTLKEELLQCSLNGYTQENYTVLLPSDELLKADGFGWQWISGSNAYGFVNSNSGSSLGNFDVNTRIQRLVKSHIFKRLKNDDVNCAITDFKTDPAFETAYNGYSYAVNEYGDMIRYKDGQIEMLGNNDDSEVVTAKLYKTFTNGQVFTIDKMLQYSPRNTYPSAPEGYETNDLYPYILKMSSGTQNRNVALFKNYFAACLKGDESNELAGLSADMVLTIFMPTNTAITKAIANGDLPTITQVNASAADRIKATAFVLYHIVKGKVFVDDGLPYIMPNDEVKTEEVWPTALKDVVDNTYLALRKNANGNLLVSTVAESTGKHFSSMEKTATVTRGIKRSNYFGAKAVLHEIDDYFVYQKAQ